MVATSQRRELGILLFVANRSLEERAFDAVIAAGITDITAAQAKVAARIGPDGTRVSDIAAQARVTKQSAAFLVEQLETAGYVERVPDPTDGRARLVRLTPRALPLIEAANAEVDILHRRGSINDSYYVFDGPRVFGYAAKRSRVSRPGVTDESEYSEEGTES